MNKVFLFLLTTFLFSLAIARDISSIYIYDEGNDGSYKCDVAINEGNDANALAMYFAWDSSNDNGEDISNWENIIRLGYVESEEGSKSFNLPPPANEAISANPNTFVARVFLVSSILNYDYFTEATQGGIVKTSYLHTNFKPQEGKTIITVDCEFPSIAYDVYLFGCYNDKYSMAAYFNNSKEFALACNDDLISWKTTGYVGVKNERILVTLDATGVNATTGSVTVVRTGEKYLAINTSPHNKNGAATSYNNLFLWGRSAGANVNQKTSSAIVYSCTITNNGVCVRDFRPAVKGGVAGMWDGVNNVFYKSAGITPLIAVGTNKTYFVSEGDTQVSVSKCWKKEIVTEYTYTGAAGDGVLTNPQNYEGNVAPDFSAGLSKLIIGEGVASLTINDEISLYGIVFDSKVNSSLIAGSTNAKINLGRGGVVTMNEDASETIAYTLGVPVSFLSYPQEWTVNASTILDLQAPLSTIGFDEEPFTISSLGQVKFSVDNPELTMPLFINGVTENTRPLIYKPKSLGSPSRVATITGSAPPLFITSDAALTNEVPISISPNSSVTLNSSDNYPLHFAELVTINSTASSSRIKVIASDKSRVYFHRGIKNKSGSMELAFDANVTIEDTLSTPNILYVIGQRNIYLAATNNSYLTLNPYRANIVCMTNNVFNKNATLEMGTSGSNYRKVGASIDLNGFDQKIKRLKRGWDYNGTYVNQKDGYSTITSLMPASLEVTSDVNQQTDITHVSTYLYTAFRFTGAAGFHFSGTGDFGFTNITSTTVGQLRVSSGNVNIYAGGGWIATTNVLIEGTGTLNVNKNVNNAALGPQLGESNCELVIAENGKLNVAEGETVTVKYFFIENETGYKRSMPSGIYGSESSGVLQDFVLNCFPGSGKIRVLKQLDGGLHIIIK